MSKGILNQFGQEMKNTYRNPDLQVQEGDDILIRADGRATYDDYYVNPLSSGFAYISPDNENDWKLKTIDEHELALQNATQLIEILVDSSPDLSRALHDICLLYTSPSPRD